MAPKYVLNYFPLTGRGEPARLMFHLAGVDFTDNQIQMSQWPQQKTDGARFPLGQMPTLQIEDLTICQGKAIDRYLADEFGFYGSSNLDRAHIDQVLETIGELSEGSAKIRFDKTKDEEKKKSELVNYFETDRSKLLLGFLTCLLAKKSGKFFLGEKPSLADIVYLNAHEYTCLSYPKLSEAYPDLAGLYQAVTELENIKQYLSTRKHKHVF